jgi:hypothetical protein
MVNIMGAKKMNAPFLLRIDRMLFFFNQAERQRINKGKKLDP